jgi:HK97 family phage major capsid protein
MTDTHKQLIKAYEKTEGELNAFIAEHGDNMTDAQYAEATRMRDDLKATADKIEHQKRIGALKDDVAELHKVNTSIAARHSHNGAPSELGATRAGEVTIARRTRDGKARGSAAFRMLKQSGAGIFGKEQFEAVASREYRDAFRAAFKGRATTAQYRTLEIGLDPQGGYLAPIETLARLIDREPTPTRVSGLVDTINIARDGVVLPRVNYTGATDDSLPELYTTGFRVTATDENPTSSTQSQVTDANIFGATRVSVWTYMIQGVLTNNMIEDAMFDPLAWLAGKFAQTVDLHKDNKILNGSGSSEPVGILANPGGTDNLSWPPVVTTGTSSSPFITPDSLLDASMDIPEQYEDGIRYVYSKRTTGKTIRKMKDANGRYLFGQGTQDSGIEPSAARSINGYPVVWSGFMPAPAANAFPIIVGDLSGYTLVNRIGFSVQVLREVAAQKNQVIVLGRFRYGGQCLEPWKLRAIKCA